MSGGWIKVYRQLVSHWLWRSERFTRGQAWIDLLLSANHRDRQIRLGNQLITVKRGQVLVSQRQLVSRWGWARNTIARFLGVLKLDKMLSHEVSHGPEGGYTLITILNYERYQGSDEEVIEHGLSHDLSDGRDTLGTRLEPYSRIKEGKKDKKRNIVGQTRPDASLNGFISEAIQYLNERTGMSYRFTTKATIRHLTARVREGFTIEDVKLVIDCKVAGWLNDPKMFGYLRPETLFGPKFEGYLNEAKRAGEEPEARAGPLWEKGEV